VIRYLRTPKRRRAVCPFNFFLVGLLLRLAFRTLHPQDVLYSIYDSILISLSHLLGVNTFQYKLVQIWRIQAHKQLSTSLVNLTNHPASTSCSSSRQFNSLRHDKSSYDRCASGNATLPSSVLPLGHRCLPSHSPNCAQ
jgi:hypothetical protein